jgi:pimeloyl-ACP methyl ester carboxylesterase
MNRRSIEINGAELTYLEAGVGPPVILINGLLGDYRSWRRQVDVLRPNYRVLALSQRYYWPNKWPDDGAGFSVATTSLTFQACCASLTCRRFISSAIPMAAGSPRNSPASARTLCAH